MPTKYSCMPFHAIVYGKISLIFEIRIYHPLVFSRNSMRLYPRITTRTTQNVGKISRPTRVGKRVWRSLPRLNRLVRGIPKLRNSKHNVNISLYIQTGAKWGDGE